MEGQEKQGGELVRCPKCGFENPSSLKYCGNCGTRLSRPQTGPALQVLSFMLISTSLYLVVSIIFNVLVRASPLFFVSYLVTGLSGLFVGFGILRGERGGLLLLWAAGAIAVGLVSSFILFLVGLTALGVIGPVWIFFVILAWVLLKARKEL